MLQKSQPSSWLLQGPKRSWIDSDLFEEWFREQDRKFERQNQKVLLIVDNCPAHPDVGGLKVIDQCFCHPMRHL